MVKVSIITRTKDRPLLLERAINSVISQSFDNWEHIIIDDNKTCQKEFDELIEKYSQQYQGRLQIIKNTDNIPMDPSINIGLKAANGEFLVIHDDDDSWEEDFLLKSVDFLEKNQKYGAVVTDFYYNIEEIIDDKIITRQKYVSETLKPLNIFNILLSQSYPCPISFLFRKKALDKVGYLSLNLLKAGDKEFVLRLLKKFEIANLSEPLANYHARPYNQAVYANCTLGNDAHKDNVYWEAVMKNELLKNNFDLWLYYHWVNFIRPYKEKQKIKKILKDCAGQKVAIYGAGIKAERLLKDYKNDFAKLNVVAVLDQNLQKHGAYLNGHLISSPESISEFAPQKIILAVANVSMVKSSVENLITQNNLNCDVIHLA